ncbi:FAS1 domain-containing protein [Dioszegia hungarica]|uniref:FAS1 domain-containing protein n=1 Tax=Dioszegia hungarica TaxID=4972 RepID=A0AA38LRS3_9TREE|nr:FAS1 domain-containing protein [Dioszegia hungarica]KAI9633495.1 FAS1 domain-containing protein [Dioszegia hungarica]
MKFSIVSLAVLAPLVLAQSTTNTTQYLTQVLGALTGAGLTSLVSVASAIANTTDGAALLASLAQGNKTVFAPNNDAFAAVPSSVSSNTTLLTQILSYHIVNTSVTANGTLIAPNHTIARTALRGGNFTLPGNRTAPLVLARNSTNATSFQILQAQSNVSVTGPVAAANLLVYVIPTVLSLPPSIGEVAGNLFPSLSGVIQSSGLLAPIANSPGVTVFAPNDAALGAISAQLAQLNSTQITSILANHVINGTVGESFLYSRDLTAANYTSAGGQPFTFMANSTGAYVMSANSTARIIRSDVIVNNGVVHVIDGVLINPSSNPSAAASAFSSGTAAAATSTEANPPLTATSMMSPSGSGGSGASASASGSRAAAGSVVSLSFVNSAIAAAVGIVGVALGGGLVLA